MMEMEENKEKIEIEKRRVRSLGIEHTIENPVFPKRSRWLAQKIEVLVLCLGFGVSLILAIIVVAFFFSLLDSFQYGNILFLVIFYVVYWYNTSFIMPLYQEYKWNFKIGIVPSLDQEVLK
jgi:hypothetical protein